MMSSSNGAIPPPMKWCAFTGSPSRTTAALALMTGSRFMKIVQRQRQRQQARLLNVLERLALGERVIDVAFDCGFASQSAFTAMFRKHFGIPPSAFFK